MKLTDITLTILEDAEGQCARCESVNVSAQNAQRTDVLDEAKGYTDRVRKSLRDEIRKYDFKSEEGAFIASMLGYCYACSAYGEMPVAEMIRELRVSNKEE